MAKLELDLNNLEEGPLRKALETLQDYITEKDNDAPIAYDIKTKYITGKIGQAGAADSIVTHDLPGVLVAAMGAFSFPPVGSTNFYQWIPIDGSKNVRFKETKKDAQVSLENTYAYTVDYTLLVTYRKTK